MALLTVGELIKPPSPKQRRLRMRSREEIMHRYEIVEKSDELIRLLEINIDILEVLLDVRELLQYGITYMDGHPW